MTQDEAVDLDSLTKEKFVVLKGVRRVVKDIDGVGYQLLQKMKSEGPDAATLIMYEIAGRCLGMNEEEVMGLTAAQVGKVAEMGASTAEAVEATIPKGKTARKKATP